MTSPFSAKRGHMPLRGRLLGMLSSTCHIDDLMFAPLACANAKHHEATIIAVVRDLIAAIIEESWFEQICAMYVSISADVTRRWQKELVREFKSG